VTLDFTQNYIRNFDSEKSMITKGNQDLYQERGYKIFSNIIKFTYYIVNTVILVF